MNEVQAVSEAVTTAVMWYDNSILMTFVGVAFGALIGFGGTLCSALLKLKEIKDTYEYDLKSKNVAAKKEICTQMLNSIYSLQRMNDGLIKPDIVSFKDESYIIMTKVKIYCSQEVCELYDKFLKQFFTTKVYNGKLVNDELIPAVRKDLGIDD